eukprot:scaffold2211_cov137-Isochrysis_galbana.AAC.4
MRRPWRDRPPLLRHKRRSPWRRRRRWRQPGRRLDIGARSVRAGRAARKPAVLRCCHWRRVPPGVQVWAAAARLPMAASRRLAVRHAPFLVLRRLLHRQPAMRAPPSVQLSLLRSAGLHASSRLGVA